MRQGAHTRRELLQFLAAAGAGAALGGPLSPAFAATTKSYDDGSTAVPPGLEGDPERVIIVGAGWAGLTIANALRNAGVDHILLEGRSRIGGRAHTKDLGGFPVDVGCSWIHGPIGNPMATFADQAGVALKNANVELDAPIIRLYDGVLDREVEWFDKGTMFTHGLNFLENESATIADELGPGASVRDGAIVFMDRYGLTGDTRRQVEYLCRMLSEFVYGRDWSRLSLEGWAPGKSESTYLGAGQGDFPDGGYRRLYKAMAGQGEVRLKHRVHTIEQRRNGVVVRATAQGRRVSVRGSHVVVTVPLGVLKHGSIRFEPRLPPAKRDAIKQMGFGAIEKVAMVFDEPFWSDPTHTHSLFISDHGAFEFPYWVDLNRISGFPGLIAFSGGPFARDLHKLGKPATLELALTRLREILGRDIPKPQAYKVTDWLGDRFSRGSYSNIPVGRSIDDMDALAEPIGGRILFAGEATSRARHSTADGALSTGIREAKRLLRAPSVSLSAG